jgi:hypothetical protein
MEVVNREVASDPSSSPIRSDIRLKVDMIAYYSRPLVTGATQNIPLLVITQVWQKRSVC